MKDNIFKVIVILSLGFIMAQLWGIRPQLKEEYVANQTVRLNGKPYVCGTVLDNQDTKSLYCTGFTDGYSWAVAQVEIDRKINNANF